MPKMEFKLEDILNNVEWMGELNESPRYHSYNHSSPSFSPFTTNNIKRLLASHKWCGDDKGLILAELKDGRFIYARLGFNVRSKVFVFDSLEKMINALSSALYSCFEIKPEDFGELFDLEDLVMECSVCESQK